MDWLHFHKDAEEIALWATLAINCWIIVAGIVFALSSLWRARLPYSQRISLAARESAFFVGYSAFCILVVYLDNFLNERQTSTHVAVGMAMGSMGIVYMI